MNVKPAVDSHKKAQKAQKERGELESFVTHPLKLSANAKSSFLSGLFRGEMLFLG